MRWLSETGLRSLGSGSNLRPGDLELLR
jgi:hypothetical protein